MDDIIEFVMQYPTTHSARKFSLPGCRFARLPYYEIKWGEVLCNSNLLDYSIQTELYQPLFLLMLTSP
jgi:hypothetical protein